MRSRMLWAAAAMLMLPLSLPAQEAPKYDVLKKMYDDAVASLKAAQDTKNQLASKNEQLAKQVADLQKQLETVSKERDELAREAASHAEKTFTLRSERAAWQEFLKRYPALQTRWRIFLEGSLLKTGPQPLDLPELAWPFRADG